MESNRVTFRDIEAHARKLRAVDALRKLSQARNDLWDELNTGALDRNGPQGPLRDLDGSIEQLVRWVEANLQVRV